MEKDKVLIVAKCNVNFFAPLFSMLPPIVLIVAKCNVNYFSCSHTTVQ